MNTFISRPRLKFQSKPPKHHFSQYAMCFVLLIGWAVFPLVLYLTFLSLQREPATGFAALLLALSFAICMSIGTRQFLKVLSAEGFELLIESDVLFLFKVDKKNNRQLSQQIALSQVDEADYYPITEFSTLVLHAQGVHDIEVPLWAFGETAEKRIIEYLKSRIQVVDIPSAIVV